MQVGTYNGIFVSYSTAHTVWKRLGTQAEFPLVYVSQMRWYAQDDVLLVATLGRGVYSMLSATTVVSFTRESTCPAYKQLTAPSLASRASPFEYANIANNSAIEPEFGANNDSGNSSNSTSSPYVNATSTNGAAVTCDAGKFTKLNGAECISCLAGRYSTSGKSTACLFCTAGSFCNTTGLSAVAGPCSAGYWCGAGSNTSTQNECAAGSYCVAGSSGPVLCPAGAYCAYAARGDYQLCPSGTYCRSAGLTAPSNLTCVEGYVVQILLLDMRLRPFSNPILTILILCFTFDISLSCCCALIFRLSRYEHAEQKRNITVRDGMRAMRGGLLLRCRIPEHARRHRCHRYSDNRSIFLRRVICGD